MSKNRIKNTVTLLASRDEAEAVMNEIANIANNKRKLTARLDAAVLKAQEEAAPGLAQCDAELKAKTIILEAWAEANPQEFAKGRKSIDFLTGSLGFRTSTPKLALLSRAFTWDTATDLVGRFLPNFIRSRPEIDKEAIIGQRDEEAIQAVLPRCGLKVTQAEAFFVEPNLTDSEVPA